MAAPGVFSGDHLYSEFAAPELVGGTRAFPIGNVIQEQVLAAGNIGMRSALSFLLLVLSGIVAAVAYRTAQIRRLGS